MRRTGATGAGAPHPATCGILTRKQIRRGTYESVAQLIAAMKRSIAAHNEQARPFVWTKSAEQILAKAVRQETSGTEHQANDTMVIGDHLGTSPKKWH